jgi:predicted ATPase
MRAFAGSRPRGITELSACGYKSILRPQKVEIRPLTILAGANSSGKSSMVQPLLLLKQTLDASFDPGPLLLEGPNVTFTSTDQFLSRLGTDQRCEAFEVGIGVGSATGINLSFKRHPERGIQIHEQSFFGGGRKGILRPDMTSRELEPIFLAMEEEWPEILRGLHVRIPTTKQPAEGSMTVTPMIQRNRCFLEIAASLEPFGTRMTVGLLTKIVEDEIRRLIHLPALRGNPERTYRVTGVGGTFPGTFEKYVASVIANWQSEDKEALEALNRSLDSLGLTYRIAARFITEARVELRVGRLPHGRREGEDDLVSVADVGSGVSQTLPVLVALLVAKPGQAVYLEEPETHLHPRAQSHMAGIMAEAAIRGVRVIAETHSSIILRSIQTLVATGKLPPGLVKLHWFTRKAEDGSTEIHSADLDKQGAFGDWPEDFDEVALETEKQYLDAVETGRKS